MDIFFEKKLFVDTPLIEEYLKQIENSHEGSLNHWFSGLMHITVQTCYNLWYLTIRLIGYINALTETALPACRDDMENLMKHPHKSIVYSKNKISKKSNPTSMFLKSRWCINQQKSGILQLPPYILICISCKRYIWNALFHINSYLFNDTVIDWCGEENMRHV